METEDEDESWQKKVLTVIVIFSMISFWRGVWGLMDEFLFPGDYTLSLWIPMLIGLSVLLLCQGTIKELV